MGRQHENVHVSRALEALDLARRELNMAGGRYAVGMTGVDEPYGMVERALKRTMEHAFPDVDAGDVYHALIDSGEDIGYCVDALRRERAEREALLDPFREYERPTITGRFGARMWELPNGWFVSLVPEPYPGDDERDRRAVAREDFELAVGVCTGRRFDVDSSIEVERVGFERAAEALAEIAEWPPR